MQEKMISNLEIAQVFNEIADLLELKDENPFKIRAYRRASQLIESLEKPLGEIDNLEELPGIGKELSEKIRLLLRGENLPILERLRSEIEPGLLNLMRVRNLGPKRVRTLNKELGIKDLDGLRRALEDGSIAKLRGFGAKLVEDIKKGLDEFGESSKRTRIDLARNQAFELLEFLKEVKGIERIEVAGSFRRRLETVGDLDILVSGKKSVAKPVMERFTEFPKVKEVLAKGDTKSSVVLKTGLKVDLRFLQPESFGAGLHYFTGSKAHNIKIRSLAKQKGLKVNEYGIFRGNKRIGGKEEAEIFEVLGLSYIAPELREDRGEIEASASGSLVRLIELKDIKGDLQVHSNASDGRDGIEEIAKRAKDLGYEYIAITDHSRSQYQANGLDEKRLRAQIKEIEKINSRLAGIKVLKGIEVDILKDGELDFEPSLLEELDIVQAAVHSHFRLSEKEQTARILKALKKGVVNILSHPTGRLLGEREPYQVDWTQIIPLLLEFNIAVEINASPHRLDANGELAFYLRENGVKFAISTDAHSVGALKDMEYGVFMARRGWLGPADVVNTYHLSELLAWASR